MLSFFQLFFPAITLCNHNRIKCSNLANRIKNCTADEEAVCSKLISLNDIACKEIKEANSTTKKRKKRAALTTNDEKGFCDTCSMPNSLKTDFEFLEKYMSIRKKERITIGHGFSDMVKECTFRGRDCLEERFSWNSYHLNFNLECLVNSLQLQVLTMATATPSIPTYQQ